MIDYKTVWCNFTEKGKKNLIKEYSNLPKDEEELLCKNLELFDRFLVEAHYAAKFRDHYSARTITEVLRHNSLASDTDKQFKINDHIVPILSYASMQMFPSLNGFFEIRKDRRRA